MKKFSYSTWILPFVIFFAGLYGCAGTLPTAEFKKPISDSYRLCSNDAANVKLVKADGVELNDLNRQRLESRIREAINERKKNSPCKTILKRSFMLDSIITRYDEGNAFARAMLAGLGKMHIDGDFTLQLLSETGSESVAEFTLQKSFGWGGIYGGVTRIEDIEATFAEGVAEAVVAQAQEDALPSNAAQEDTSKNEKKVDAEDIITKENAQIKDKDINTPQIRPETKVDHALIIERQQPTPKEQKMSVVSLETETIELKQKNIKEPIPLTPEKIEINQGKKRLPVSDNVAETLIGRIKDPKPVRTEIASKQSDYLQKRQTSIKHPKSKKVNTNKTQDKNIFDIAQSLFKKGLDMNSSKNYSEAIKAYSSCLTILKDDSNVHFNIGIAYQLSGQFEKAITSYTNAIELAPGSADAYYNRGIAHHQIGNLGLAINDYTRAIQLNGKDADAYWNRGIAFVDRGDYTHAMSDYCKAIDIEPPVTKARQ